MNARPVYLYGVGQDKFQGFCEALVNETAVSPPTPAYSNFYLIFLDILLHILDNEQSENVK